MKRTILLVLGVAALLYTAMTALTQVAPGEKAVVRRFGRVLADKPGPGLYRGLPWGMEQVDRVPVGMVRRVFAEPRHADWVAQLQKSVSH